MKLAALLGDAIAPHFDAVAEGALSTSGWIRGDLDPAVIARILAEARVSNRANPSNAQVALRRTGHERRSLQ